MAHNNQPLAQKQNFIAPSLTQLSVFVNDLGELGRTFRKNAIGLYAEYTTHLRDGSHRRLRIVGSEPPPPTDAFLPPILRAVNSLRKRKCSSSRNVFPNQFGSRAALLVQQLEQGGTAGKSAASPSQSPVDRLPRFAGHAVNRTGTYLGPFPRPLPMRIRPGQDMFEGKARPETSFFAKKSSQSRPTR